MDERLPFELRSVVHLVRPTRSRARTMEDLRRGIAEAPDACLFYHALQYRLRNPACDELPLDDLSAWVDGVVQDRETAERLSFAVQSHNTSPGELRAALLAVLDGIPATVRLSRTAPLDGELVFLAVVPVAVPTGIQVSDTAALVGALREADASVWFYHVIEQPWFRTESPTLGEWLASRGETLLASWFAESTASGVPIETARSRLLRRWRQSHLGRHLTDVARLPDDLRREAGRQAVAQLVRRMRRPEPPA